MTDVANAIPARKASTVSIRKVLGTPKRELRDVPVGQCALPTPRDEEENEYDDFDIRRITFNLEGAF